MSDLPSEQNYTWICSLLHASCRTLSQSLGCSEISAFCYITGPFVHLKTPTHIVCIYSVQNCERHKREWVPPCKKNMLTLKIKSRSFTKISLPSSLNNTAACRQGVYDRKDHVCLRTPIPKMMYVELPGTPNSLHKWSSLLLPGPSSQTGVLWNPNKTSLERSGWTQAGSSGLNQQSQKWGESHSFLLSHLCFITWFAYWWNRSVLSSHFISIALGTALLRAKRRLLSLLMSLHALFLEVCPDHWHPQGETLSLLSSPPWLLPGSSSCAWWLAYVVHYWQFSLETYSTTFRTKEGFLVNFSPPSERDHLLLSVTIREKNKVLVCWAPFQIPCQGLWMALPATITIILLGAPHHCDHFSDEEIKAKRPCHLLKVTKSHDLHWVRCIFFQVRALTTEPGFLWGNYCSATR